MSSINIICIYLLIKNIIHKCLLNDQQILNVSYIVKSTSDDLRSTNRPKDTAIILAKKKKIQY